MLQNILLIAKTNPSIGDTLKKKIQYLEIKVDSLQKITERTEIGKDFFSDALTMNLTYIGILIGVASLINWGFISLYLSNHKRRFKKEILEFANTKIEPLEVRLKSLHKKILNANYASARSMFLIFKDDEKSQATAFLWLFRSISAHIDQKENINTKTILYFLKKAKEYLTAIPTGSQSLIDYHSEMSGIIQNVSLIEVEEIQKLSKEIERDLNHIVYSKPNPPEDLLQGHASKPPSS